MHSWLAWGAPEYVLEREQWVPGPMEEVFPFFEDPYNLAKITPGWLRFTVTSMTPETVQERTVITYRLKWLGIPYTWRTVIESWSPNVRFTDRMLNGPYILWHHTHTFEARGGGIFLTDRVRYRIPFGPVGMLLHALIIRRQVNAIFAYRVNKIAELLSGGRVFHSPPDN